MADRSEEPLLRKGLRQPALEDDDGTRTRRAVILEAVELGDVLRPLVDSFSVRAEELAVEFRCDLPDETSGPVFELETDRNAVERIVLNLLDNATPISAISARN